MGGAKPTQENSPSETSEWCRTCHVTDLTHTPHTHHTQSSFLVCSEGVESVKSGLAIGNSIVGYAYLVDKEGRVRWRAHATPNEREIKALIKCTKTLMNGSKNSKNR